MALELSWHHACLSRNTWLFALLLPHYLPVLVIVSVCLWYLPSPLAGPNPWWGICRLCRSFRVWLSRTGTRTGTWFAWCNTRCGFKPKFLRSRPLCYHQYVSAIRAPTSPTTSSPTSTDGSKPFTIDFGRFWFPGKCLFFWFSWLCIGLYLFFSLNSTV